MHLVSTVSSVMMITTVVMWKKRPRIVWKHPHPWVDVSEGEETPPSSDDLSVCKELKRNGYGAPQTTKIPFVIRTIWYSHRRYCIFVHSVEDSLLRGYILQARRAGTIVGQFYSKKERTLLDCYPGFHNTIYFYSKRSRMFDYVWWSPYIDVSFTSLPADMNFTDLYMECTIILKHDYFWHTRVKISPPPAPTNTVYCTRKYRMRQHYCHKRDRVDNGTKFLQRFFVSFTR